MQCPMKTRYRELKIALVDNQDKNFDAFFYLKNMKLFIATSGYFFPNPRSSNSGMLGIFKYYEHGKALAHSGTLRAPRKPNLVFHFFSSLGNLGYLQRSIGPQMCLLTLKLILKLHVVLAITWLSQTLQAVLTVPRQASSFSIRWF